MDGLDKKFLPHTIGGWGSPMACSLIGGLIGGSTLKEKPKNYNQCENCGANLKTETCEYCGSFFGGIQKNDTIEICFDNTKHYIDLAKCCCDEEKNYNYDFIKTSNNPTRKLIEQLKYNHKEI